MLSLSTPYPFFADKDGDPLDGGYIYIGVVDLNPETDPVTVYWDEAGTQPAEQPLRTSAGYIVRNGTPTRAYVTGDDFSMTVKDKKGQILYYEREVASVNTLRSDLANPATGADGVGYTPSSGGTAGIQAATVAVNLNARTRSVLDFIPRAKHSGIRSRTNTDDLTSYFQNAAIAVNRDVVSGAGSGGKVLVPNGRFRINKVGCRNTVFEGEHMGGTLIEAYSAGTGVLLDCALDRDGTTANTDGGQGGFTNMKIDGRSLGYSGVRTYGGFAPLSDLWVTGCVDAFLVGLPIEMQVARLYGVSNSGQGFRTYGGAGDRGTSLNAIGCWMQGNGTYNWHIEQLSYSTFMGCASQSIGAAGIGWFIEGGTNGSGVGTGIQLISCGSEGDLGKPFYFKAQRGLGISSPVIVSPPANKNLVTFENASGTLTAFQSPTPGGGFYGVDVISFGDSAGGLVTIGGDFTIASTNLPYLTVLGSSVNGRRLNQVAGSLRGSISSPAILSASVNDYAVADGVGVARLNPAAGGTSVTGLAMTSGNADGCELVVHNLSTVDNLTLVHASASSSAANRFSLPSSANAVIPPLGSATLLYDATAQRWKKL